MTKEILSYFYSLRIPCQLFSPPTHFAIIPSYPTDIQYKFTLVQYVAFCSPKNCVDLCFSGTNWNTSKKGVLALPIAESLIAEIMLYFPRNTERTIFQNSW